MAVPTELTSGDPMGPEGAEQLNGRRGRRARPVAPPNIVLDRASPEAMYRQIATAIRREIESGVLAPGDRLPAERQLATHLGVDRTTVVAAYRMLAADGLIESRVGRGTLVSPLREHALEPHDRVMGVRRFVPIVWDERFAPREPDDPTLAELTRLTNLPHVISLANGVPSPETYPIAAFRELLDEALGVGGEGLLQYCPPEGADALRQALGRRMRHRGMPVSAGQILVCAGSQQGLYLLARSLIEPGDVVLVEGPTYLGALQVFRAAGARLVTIPSDREGVDPDRLHDLLRRRTAKLLYLLPTYQNPTGETLSLDRRERLLWVATRHGIPIIEDDPYGELRYSGEEIPSLFGLAGPNGPVIYLSTFSKVLFPGFRLGWIAGPNPVIERLAWEKTLVDLDSNPLAQWAVSAYLDRGLFAEHLNRVRALYPSRRDAIADALEDGARDDLVWNTPTGGFYLWARLTGGVRAREVLAEGAAAGVAFVPGDLFYADGGGHEALRIAFSALPPSVLREGALRLARAIQTVTERRSRGKRASGRPSRIV